MERTVPVLYLEKALCCGCSACFAICPRDAVSLIEDEEGFEFPIINKSKCIRCYQCLNVCPIREIDKLNDRQHMF